MLLAASEICIVIQREGHIEAMDMFRVDKSLAKMGNLNGKLPILPQGPVKFHHEMERAFEMFEHMRGFDFVNGSISKRQIPCIQIRPISDKTSISRSALIKPSLGN